MDMEKAAQEILQVLADAVGGETRRDERARGADVEQHEERAEQEVQHRMRVERELLAVQRRYETEQRLRKEAEETAALYAGRLDDLRELYETEQGLRKEAEYKLVTLVELRKRAKDVLDNDGDLLDHALRVRLERAYRWTETPAEGAARLRME